MENNNLQTILSTMIQHLGVIVEKLDEVLERLEQVQEPMPVQVQPTSIDSTVAELVASSKETTDSADAIIQRITEDLLDGNTATTPVKTREQCIEEITAGLQFDPALVGSVLQTTNSGVTDPMLIAGTLGVSVETISAILGLGRDDLVKHITALASIQALPY